MKTRTIPKITFRHALLVILILAAPLSGFWILQSYQVYREDVRIDAAQYMERHQEQISNQVRSAVDFLDYMRSQAESRTRATIRSRVYEAHAIATHLYEKYHASKSPEEMRSIVREALRPIRYNNGRGYYSAQSMDGLTQLFADHPEIEGTCIMDMRDPRGGYPVRGMNEFIRNHSEGFFSYPWTKPGDAGKDFVKISFLKRFEPLDWFILSGEYVEDTEAEIRQEVVDRLAQVRWGNDGYLFVIGADGVCLNHVDPAMVGRSLMNVTDARGKFITQEFFRVGRSGGGFVEYSWYKPNMAQAVPKLAYAQVYEPWGWAICAGTYLDDIAPVLAEKHARLRHQLAVSVGSVMLLVLTTGSLAIVFASRLTRRLQREFGVFDHFFRNGAHTEQEISDDVLSFTELRSLAASANAMVTKRRQDEAALRTAKEAAEDANRCKSSFLANMSHEIRTPMTTILGYSELIAEGCPGHCTYGGGELRETLSVMRRNGQHLLEIINDILDLSKIEAEKLAIERKVCSPQEIVADVASLVRVRAEAKHLAFDIAFTGPIPETMQTDPLRLRQILLNLLGNAIKFTDSGSIRLAVCLRADEEPPRIQFEVIDTGCGLTPEEAARLFQPFSQADASTTRRFGGTGLGLAISKRLAQLLGGDVVLVQSQAGQGARFRATVAVGSLEGVRLVDGESMAEAIRIGPPAAEEILPAAQSGQLLQGLRLLLAEDGPDNRRLITHLLTKAGAQVAVAEDGQQAVAAALAARDADAPFDAILMDMQMPVMDGYEATRLLRVRDYHGPIIALTAHAMSTDRDKCIQAGCDDYSCKPIDRQALILAIRKHTSARACSVG
jgi:signal transduction histidine kinase/ActR/RegA family two-component response regulator